ncbi:hypothetical protein TNCV_4727711 [Trichonephila clavipes]|nr:hypothetical protein TNCV_4727711 [Trichonephila clavipes]
MKALLVGLYLHMLGPHVAWGPRIIETADTAVAMPLVIADNSGLATFLRLELILNNISYPASEKYSDDLEGDCFVVKKKHG